MTELLVEKGWEVVCPVRDMSNLRNLSGIQARAIPLADVASEVGRNQGFDYVIHLAGATPRKITEVTVRPTSSPLDACWNSFQTR